jgi:hypothetical protein
VQTPDGDPVAGVLVRLVMLLPQDSVYSNAFPM